MKSFWIEQNIPYDGSQLTPLFAYLNHEVLGNSIVAWQGPCNVSFQHMIDGEDLLVKSKIQSDQMLHFIVEIFDERLITAVSLQRLLSTIVQNEIQKQGFQVERRGDDLFFEDRKLNVSIASNNARSCMIHFGLNISNEGTPIPTSALCEFNLNAQDFAFKILKSFSEEFASIIRATQKVRPL